MEILKYNGITETRDDEDNLLSFEWNDGTKEWYKEGKLHRVDGPAVEYNDGGKRWYYEGKQIECNSTEEFLKIINLKAFW